jgi:hypothetical protein
MSKVAAAPGGDGIAPVESTTEEIQPIATRPELPDASATDDALNSHIDEVLGLPKQDIKSESVPTDATTESTAGESSDDSTEAEDETPAEDSDEFASADESTESDAKPTPDKPVQADTVKNDLVLNLKDANGKEFVLKPGDDIDEVLKDFEPTGTGQIMRIIGDFNKLNADAAQQEANAATEADKAAQVAEQQATINAWDKEIAGLQTEGRIGKPTLKPTDPGYLKDPTVVRVDQVFKYMTTENAKRATAAQAAGTTPLLIRSFGDALDKLELQEMRQAQAKAKANGLDAAKAKSSLIGGGNGNTTNAPAPYIAGSHSSIWDV